MTLSDRQSNFAQDVAKLLFWCAANGYKITLGEALRTQYQQNEYMRRGLTKAKHSRHQDKMAIDLNIFVSGLSMWSMTKDMQKLSLQPIGDYWESLRTGNEWGGNWDFYDPGHFQA